MADIEAPLSYGRLTGDFWAVLEDSADLDLAPDTAPLMGDVTFTPSYRVLRVSSDEVSKRGVVYVDSVTAQVVNGVLVDDFGEPGISLLAATEIEGMVVPHDISWTATFNLTMSTGEPLVSQPESTRIRLVPGETRAISDFVPSAIDGGGFVRVVSVDQETMRHVDAQVEYIDEMVNELSIIIEDGVAKGEPGEKGDTGEQGPIGPYGPPGRAGLVETINYVTNPTPTSNDGFFATNGTVSFSGGVLTLTPDDYSMDSYVSWVKAIPTFPGTNMYLQFDANTSDPSSTVKSTITFLNAELEPVDFDSLTHGSVEDIDVPLEVESEDVGTYSHMSYTDGPSSFSIFSVGIPAGTSQGTTVSVSKFFFSDSPGYYFTGDSVVEGYNVRWMGSPNDSYSVLTPVRYFESNVVTSLNGEIGDLTLDAETLGLGLVDNTSDEDKPISSPTQEALDLKVDKSTLAADIAAGYEVPIDSMYLKEFTKFATQEVWKTSTTFVDISYVIAPVGGSNLVRLVIPGSTSGNSPSSVPTVELSTDGETWTVWRTLTTTPPGSISYTSIDGAFDESSGVLKVLVREESSTGSVTLHLYSVDNTGGITEKILGTYTATSDPYNKPSIVPTRSNDGSLYMYYTNSSGSVVRKTISSSGVLGTAITNLTGLKSNSYAKVSRFYGTYIAATPDGSAVGSPGILISSDGTSWRGKTVTTAHTWSRGASVITMSAYPGVSGGKIGIFIDYVNGPNYNLHRIFITSRPTITGKLTGVTTGAGETSTLDSDISFPGTLTAPPTILVSSNDSRLNLGVIGVTGDGGTIERFNLGESPSSNATISWTAIS